MTIQSKLLVLVDGSQRTIQIATYIKEFMPVDEHTRIVLFHVLTGVPEEYRELLENPTCEGAVGLLKTQEMEAKRRVLESLVEAKQILLAGGFPESSVEIKVQCLKNGVARDIIEEARNGYSAVVLRRRGLGALKNMILGSVAVKLLQSLTFIPILLVGQAPPVKKVLVAVDASPHSMKAVAFAASVLGGHGYEVRIFHAIVGLGAIQFQLQEDARPESFEATLPDSCIEAFKEKVARLFQAAKHIFLEAGFESGKISEKVLSGVHSRSEAIVKEAEEGGYGTVVVGRRGLSKVEAFFMGRVSHAVVYEGNNLSVWVV